MEELHIDEEIIQKTMNKLSKLELVVPEYIERQFYTLRHKQAFMAVRYTLIEHVFPMSSQMHDVDKLWTYPVLGEAIAKDFHAKMAKHHYGNWKSGEDFLNAIIDYECCRFTKPDKPMNAKQTIEKLFPDCLSRATPVLVKFGINSEIPKDIDFSEWNKNKSMYLTNMMSTTLTVCSYLKKQTGFVVGQALTMEDIELAKQCLQAVYKFS